MTLSADQLEQLIFGSRPGRRFTQDSPVMPDVWLAYGVDRANPADLLLTPHAGASEAELAAELHRRVGGGAGRAAPDREGEARIAHSETYVVAELSFEELVTAALPLSRWWTESIRGSRAEFGTERELASPPIYLEEALGLAEPSLVPLVLDHPAERELAPALRWLIHVVGRIACELAEQTTEPSPDQVVAAARPLLERALGTASAKPLLFQVSLNREARLAISRSRLAVKADAAVRVFDLDCKGLTWAVIDSGVDATHPAFRERDATQTAEPILGEPFEPRAGGGFKNNTRVLATYDFTRLRVHLNPEGGAEESPRLAAEQRRRVKDLREGLLTGRSIDWGTLEPLLRVPHEPDGAYTPPRNEHGTHVAGILTADWRPTDREMPEEKSLVGIAPGLRLYDLRVIRDDGTGDEFSVIAALQFVRYLNAQRDKPLVHGVNISLAIPHDVSNYACGRTPVCQECERLLDAGVVVVAAAGNAGYARFQTLAGRPDEGFRGISITDPGNAEEILTVGATHPKRPHSYGISYFSSRGPTGDGRNKPDLVAPGEKIVAPIPGLKAKSLDGTSMAAPHVSAAAALLMARNEELVGEPARIKQILCDTATDLGRERYFQGHGMLDILRAIQSV
jgi:hypothetical protein